MGHGCFTETGTFKNFWNVLRGSMSRRESPFENERASLLKLNTRKYSKLISDEMIHENNLLIRTDQINLISGQWN